ncbi:L,D-transpeptidase family protein [Roseococcus sp. SYP-B2431]|uniref:L,D-transpeptidase family protein n=1 Tax=Roseococcus sp. SYP-B2431 TaxID=2496640 RepID=UPI0013F3E96C|nr:L,D-transpeptidase family protein [Roseococcus sp. SYP-B2431]
MARSVLYGSASAIFAPAVLAPGAASAQTRVAAAQIPAPVILPPLTVLDTRDQLRVAQASLPFNHRSRTAVQRTLERLDDMGLDLSVGRAILVNIAAAELIAYEGGVEILRSRVVVGAPRTRTPQLTTYLTTVRFHPPWYVPASIAPEIRANGAVGFQQVGGRLIQPPGPTNPLGPLRIGLQDSDGIFLHGTNRPGLFARPGRALSHGCVRVERVRDLAAWLLDTTPASVDATLATGRTQDVHPLQEVQVALAYLTIWPDRGRQLVAYADNYGLDAPGARRASFRRVYRAPPQTPEQQMEAAARLPPQEDDPL